MVHSDDYGLVLPPKIAPTQVVIVPIGKDENVLNICNNINEKLNNDNHTSFVDDSERTPGYKFAEYEVNGIPVRVEVGARDLANGTITLARRDTREKITVKYDDNIVSTIEKLLEDIQQNLYDSALKRREALTFEAKTYNEMKSLLDKQSCFVKAMWCGDEECELKVKEIRGAKSRCILENEKPISDKCAICGKPAKHLVVWDVQY